jgi:hypothetical protein
MTTCGPVVSTLPRLRRASGRAVSPLDFSSVGRTGSHRAPGRSVSRLDHACVVHPGASARHAARLAAGHAARRRLLRLRRTSGCLGTSSGSSSTMCRLAARLLVGRSQWLSSCVRSLCLAARLLVVRIALDLLRLYRASGRIVSPLDFSSVGRTCSRRASDHFVSRCDYSSSGLHLLYCAYVVHPDASSRRSTSRRSVALALAMRPVTASRSATTHHLYYTSSTAPTSCIQTCRLDARLLVSQSH